MQFIYLIGRISLVAIFLGSSARSLLNLPATAQLFENWVPSLFAPYAEKLSTLLGVPSPQLIAIIIALIQIALSLAIIFNVGSRFAAILLALYLAGLTAYVFDFTNFNDLSRIVSDTMLLNNISIIGGLLILFALESWSRVELEEGY
jgi:putative oxidoreductase